MCLSGTPCNQETHFHFLPESRKHTHTTTPHCERARQSIGDRSAQHRSVQTHTHAYTLNRLSTRSLRNMHIRTNISKPHIHSIPHLCTLFFAHCNRCFISQFFHCSINHHRDNSSKQHDFSGDFIFLWEVPFPICMCNFLCNFKILPHPPHS